MMIGHLQSLWRFPVKSFGGESLNEALLTTQGLFGDRAYALIDQTTGHVVSAKSARLFPDLLLCQAAYITPPQPGQVLPPVQIMLADGTQVRSDDPEVNQCLSQFWGRRVMLARSAPENFTIDQYHPDLEGLNPAGYRDTVTTSRLGAALFTQMGVTSPVSLGSFMDVFPYSLMTTSTLDRLSQLNPASRFDMGRFRVNLVLQTSRAGFLENQWVSSHLLIGDQAILVIAMPTPRCVMTTLAQPGLPADTHVLRTLVTHNRMEIMGGGQFPCAGVYGTLVQQALVKVGDAVRILTDTRR